MAKIGFYLSEEEKAWVKEQGPSWFRDVVRVAMQKPPAPSRDDPKPPKPVPQNQPQKNFDDKLLAWKREHPGQMLSPETLKRLKEEK